MIKYYEKSISNLSERLIDTLYIELLKSKYNFIIIKFDQKKYILTKEKSMFQINNLTEFLKQANNDIYYKTVKNLNQEYLIQDLNIFKNYIQQYKSQMQKTYGDKYLFGNIAVRTTNDSFITTIRGKENLEEFTIVNSVDEENHVVYSSKKKATLNAPLLNQIFKNPKVKIIVHINHQYDNTLPFYEYAFPGTVRDSKRKNETSFNIKHHGVFWLLDEEGRIIKND